MTADVLTLFVTQLDVDKDEVYEITKERTKDNAAAKALLPYYYSAVSPSFHFNHFDHFDHFDQHILICL